MNPNNNPHSPQLRLESFLGNLLRLGVLLSLATILLGLIMLFMQHPEYADTTPASEIVGLGAEYPNTPAGVIAGVMKLCGPSVVMLGVVLLIATPLLRVLASALSFTLLRDWVYTFITSLVLLILIVAFLVGRHG